MPLMNGGSLQNILSYKYSNGINDESVLATILKDVLSAIIYLHENKLIHRDIKSGNILVDMEGNIKLADFGVASHLKNGRKKSSVVGSCCWMAPEIISGADGYDYKADVWSFGISAIELAQGKAPYHGQNKFEIMRKIQMNPPQKLKDPSKWSDEFVSFIKSCLVKDPNKRPSAEQLLKQNEKFFEKAKDTNFLKTNFIKDIPEIFQRFGRFSPFSELKRENSTSLKEKKIEWKLDLIEIDEIAGNRKGSSYNDLINLLQDDV